MDGPLLQREEGVRFRGSQALHQSGGGQHRIGLEAQGGDGYFFQQVLPQRRQRFRPLTLRCRAAGGQQNVGVLIGKAAVIQRTLRADNIFTSDDIVTCKKLLFLHFLVMVKFL